MLDRARFWLPFQEVRFKRETLPVLWIKQLSPAHDELFQVQFYKVKSQHQTLERILTGSLMGIWTNTGHRRRANPKAIRQVWSADTDFDRPLLSRMRDAEKMEANKALFHNDSFILAQRHAKISVYLSPNMEYKR